MSVGPISRGLNSLLGRLSSVGPQGPQQGSGIGARPPIEGIKSLPQRPNFQQRYQQDAFEDGPKRGGRGGRGGGLDLSGGQRDFGAPAQGQGQQGHQAQGQARASQDSQATTGVQQGQAKKQPAQVLDFQKGKPGRERDDFQQQPQKAGGQAGAGAHGSKGAAGPKQPMPKPKPQKPPKPPKPTMGAAFKPAMVAGEVKMERRTTPERMADGPSSQKIDESSAAQAMGAQFQAKG
jgi:hypothetical protein